MLSLPEIFKPVSYPLILSAVIRRFVYAFPPLVSDEPGPAVLALASIAGVEDEEPVIEKSAPSIVTPLDDISKHVSDPPDTFPVSVYVPGKANSPQVDIFPGVKTAAETVFVFKKANRNIALIKNILLSFVVEFGIFKIFML